MQAKESSGDQREREKERERGSAEGGMAEVEKKEEEIVSVDANEAAALLISGSRYLDVRMEEDYLKGHVEGALNIPYYIPTPEGREKNPEFLDRVSAVFSPDETFIVGCMTGTRSRLATTDLQSAGFANVKNMKAGYRSWIQLKAQENKAQEVNKA